MVLGEGAGAVVLEDLDRAVARGAHIFGEVLAGASSSVAEARLLARRDLAMRNALAGVLANSGTAAEQVGHLHAHGLSTHTSDVEEAWAIQNVFGTRAQPLPVVAAKGNFGNLGAGAGMVELVASLLAMEHGTLPRVLNYETPDPRVPVGRRLQRRPARRCELRQPERHPSRPSQRRAGRVCFLIRKEP